MSQDPYQERVDAAFSAVARENFLPEKIKSQAHKDRPLPIGRNQTNSQPSAVHDMLTLLDVPIGAKVLDVGSGSGWTTALLAHLIGPKGSVYGLEIEPDLVSFGQENLAKFDLPWATIRQATKGKLGDAEHSPYDRILVSASARRMPPELFAQLAVGGILVMPASGQLWRATKKEDGKASIERFGEYLFVPLR